MQIRKEWFQVGQTLVLLFIVVTTGCAQAVKLQVNTVPPGAKLYWNTQPIGTAPRVVTLPPDSSDFPVIHVFEARRSGYEPAFHYLTHRPKPSPAGKASITIPLKKLPEGVSDADVPEALPYNPDYQPGKKKSPFFGALACEVKLVRVSDGKVLCQVSDIARHEHIDLCAEALARQVQSLAPDGREGELAVATTRNRRETDLGRDLAKKMTQSLRRELSFNSPFGVVKELDLESLIGEDMKDMPFLLRDPEIREELRGVRYVVLSGLAETVDPNE